MSHERSRQDLPCPSPRRQAAVGINIEDGSAAPSLLAAKIERIKAAAAARNIDLFVNARTDVYLRGLVPEEKRVEETLARAAELGALGVKRISAGSGIAQRVWAEAERLARDFLQDGKSEPLASGGLDYGKLQQLFSPH